jgi:iron only hydrogenase large subunit-like protein
MQVNHSVTLDKDKCKGCTTCIKHCPTEAIRVRNGRAHIIEERCIDCGECIRVCPHKAKKAICDPLDIIDGFEYKIALPAPSLYGQFRNLEDINIVLQGLLDIGFDQVQEVSQGAEMVSSLTRQIIEKTKDHPKPYISSACPAVVKLICMRFPKLMPNIVNIIAPFEIVAVKARREASQKTGLDPSKIGVFFITPCPAKVTAGRYPAVLKEPVVDGSIAVSEVYKKLLSAMKKIKNPPQRCSSGIIGIGWAQSGGESAALLQGQNLSVDGIENIIRVLEELESGIFDSDIDFLELNACNQGCVGGCLTVENPYVARTRIKQLMKYLPVSLNKVEMQDAIPESMTGNKPLEYKPVWELDEDRSVAMEKYSRIAALKEALPGLDCGSCGAPSCQALAEDIVLGHASEEDCIFRMRERMQYLAGSNAADDYLPPPFRKKE